jgi:hypothetical protein
MLRPVPAWCGTSSHKAYRHLRIEPWVIYAKYPRELLPYDEGSTQVNCVVTGDNPPIAGFIEAKYNSNLSFWTASSNGQNRYPTDQLIRNARVGLQACGYYKDKDFFMIGPRDFVLILLNPTKGHSLDQHFRNPERLRESIPHNDRLVDIPALSEKSLFH